MLLPIAVQLVTGNPATVPVLMAATALFLLAALFLLLGFAVDLAHRALDPRLKSAGVGSQEVSA